MARVRDVGIDEVPDDVKPTYKRFSEEYGPFLNQVKVFAHRPVAVKHIQGLLLELAQEAVLPKRDLEIALVTVSKLNECAYCVTHHAPRLVDQGISAEAADGILEETPPGFSERDKLVRDYARAVTETPQYIRDQMFEDLRQHFTEEQIVELTLRTALCGFFNKFNDALQIETEDSAIEDLLTTGLEPEKVNKVAGE